MLRSAAYVLALWLIACQLQPQRAQEENSMDRYIACDFDLPNLEAIVAYLPELCRTLYANRTDQLELYQEYMQEAQAFDRFIRKLNAIEWPADREQPAFDAALRARLYNAADVPDCGGMNETSTAEDVLLCKQQRYAKLEAALP